MTKIKKIKNAYGIFYNVFKDDIDKDGWLNVTRYSFNEDIEKELYYNKLCLLDIEKRNDDDVFSIRPKSIEGIELNNGWIRIKSKNDLPLLNDYQLFFVISKDNVFNKNEYVGIDSWWGNDEFKANEWMENHTHYQNIKNPKKPIY